MFEKFFSTLTNKLFTGALLVCFTVIGILWWSNGRKDDRNEAMMRELATETARHAVTRQSVGTLEAVIADLNAQAGQRAEAFADAQELAAEREKELAGLRRSSDAVVSRLRALSEREGQCAVPEDLRELAEGL